MWQFLDSVVPYYLQDGSVQLTKKEDLIVSKKRLSRVQNKQKFYGGFVKVSSLIVVAGHR